MGTFVNGGSMAQTIREKAKIRQGREQGRATEDEIARARLDPRDGKPPADSAKVTQDPERDLQIPDPLDPGHTA